MSDKGHQLKPGDLIDHLLGELPEDRDELLERELADDPALAQERDEVASLITQLHILKPCPSETPDVSEAVMRQLSAEKERARFWFRPVLTPLRVGSYITALATIVLLVNLPRLHFRGSTTHSYAPPAQAPAISGPTGRSYSTVANYNNDRVAEASDVILAYINGSLGALVMIGFGLTSFILAIAASTAPTRRRGLAIASAVCALLAVSSFVLRSLVNT